MGTRTPRVPKTPPTAVSMFFRFQNYLRHLLSESGGAGVCTDEAGDASGKDVPLSLEGLLLSLPPSPPSLAGRHEH